MLLWVIFFIIVRSIYKSSVLSSGFILVFFSYGHIPLPDISKTIISFTFLLLVFLYMLSIKKENENITKSLNFFSIVLLGLTVFQVFYSLDLERNGFVESELKTNSGSMKAVKPDIYYIVLDGYARQDTLKTIYNYDNSYFINSLKDQGFFVASNSFSNYCQTTLSLASSLNLSYHYSIKGLEHYKNTSNRLPLLHLIRNNHISKLLKQENYETIAFPTGYTYTEIENADRYIKENGVFSQNEFTYIVLNVTPIPYLFDFVKNPLIESHRSKILSIFKKLPEVKRKNKPMFVFAHIVAPHPPFVFGVPPSRYMKTFTYADGTHLINKNGITHQEYLELYPKQLEYISKEVLKMVNKIIENSEHPPVIIIQSDHGPGSGLNHGNAYKTNYLERFSILNALYLPGVKKESLTNNLTPINTFRYILNHYFNGKYNILNNKSYCSSWSSPYKFIDVTSKLTDE